MLRAKVQWFILGFLMACIIGIPYYIMVMNKYEERCMVAEVIIAEPFAGGSMRVKGEQMICGSNWTHSHIYFPGFDEYLGRMWQDELKKNPLTKKEREEEK